MLIKYSINIDEIVKFILVFNITYIVFDMTILKLAQIW